MEATNQQHERTQDMSLKQRYDAVKQRIDDAARRAGRSGDDVLLVAVTKYASIDQVREMIELGHVDFGESRAQQLVQRAAQMDEYVQRHRERRGSRDKTRPRPVRWHMVGHLQRNKVRKAVEHARLIHSVDSLRLAEEIQNAAAKRELPVELLVQVNIADEKNKHGVAPPAAKHLVEQIDTMLNLEPRGIMCMAPYAENPDDVRAVFDRCRELFVDIRKSGAGGEKFNILSMGMSNDFEIAIECGSNMVRLGSTLFGEQTSEEDE